MNVETISMSREDALEQVQAYRERKRRDNEEEYEAIAAAYEKLAEGAALINVDDAIRNAGVFGTNCMPKLAIARADRKEVRGEWRERTVRFYAGSQRRWSGSNSPSLTYHVDMGESMSFAHRRQCAGAWSQGFAMVPIIPPAARPKHGELRGWFILWEVDAWHTTSKTSPPTDPLLLEHLGGPLFAVLAAWDLTPLERAVLGHIRNTDP